MAAPVLGAGEGRGWTPHARMRVGAWPGGQLWGSEEAPSLSRVPCGTSVLPVASAWWRLHMPDSSGAGETTRPLWLGSWPVPARPRDRSVARSVAALPLSGEALAQNTFRGTSQCGLAQAQGAPAAPLPREPCDCDWQAEQWACPRRRARRANQGL